jgi:hypothetical protein
MDVHRFAPAVRSRVVSATIMGATGSDVFIQVDFAPRAF